MTGHEMTPEVHHHALTGIAAIGLGSGLSVVGFVLAEVASTEHVPLAYYFATFVGLGLVVSVIKFWTWFEDRQKKELTLSETRMKGELEKVEGRLHEELRDQFTAHNKLDDERHRRIEEMIRSAIPHHQGGEG